MNAINLTTEQRNLLYDEIVQRLTGISDVYLAVERENWQMADRVSREFADYLTLLHDDLGWGESATGSVALTSSPEVLRRVLERLKDRAEAEDRDEAQEREEANRFQKRNETLRGLCDELLVGLAHG